jgi:hypothetical protein
MIGSRCDANYKFFRDERRKQTNSNRAACLQNSFSRCKKRRSEMLHRDMADSPLMFPQDFFSYFHNLLWLHRWSGWAALVSLSALGGRWSHNCAAVNRWMNCMTFPLDITYIRCSENEAKNNAIFIISYLYHAPCKSAVSFQLLWKS